MDDFGQICIYRKLLTTKRHLLIKKISSHDITYIEHINLYYPVFSNNNTY